MKKKKRFYQRSCALIPDRRVLACTSAHAWKAGQYVDDSVLTTKIKTASGQ